jgi:cysteine desulfurase
MGSEAARIMELRDYLHEGLARRLQDVHLNGHPEHRLPGCLNLRLGEVDGARLLIGLRDHIALSSGSACASGTTEPSHVLRAIGVTDANAFSSVRFGLGRFTTRSEVGGAIERLVEEMERQCPRGG